MLFHAPPGPVRAVAPLLPWMGIDGPFSLPQLIQAGSLDLRLSATLWALLARRASLFVVAQPRLAGKSTTLAALLELLPQDTLYYPIGGSFSRTELAGLPKNELYLIVNELSDHIPGRYLWDDGARELLHARTDGYAVSGTLHAGSPAQVAEMLMEPPVRATPRQVAGIDVILTLREPPAASRGVQAAFIADGEELQAPVFHMFARGSDDPRGVFRHEGGPKVLAALARRMGTDPGAAALEVAAREAYLRDAFAKPLAGTVRTALAGFTNAK